MISNNPARLIAPRPDFWGYATLVLGDDIGAPKPDFFIYPRGVALTGLRGGDTLLVVEISDTTIAWDRDVKVPAYEKGGVREHWRIEWEARQIVVYQFGADGAYGAPTVVAFDGTVEAVFVPGRNSGQGGARPNCSGIVPGSKIRSLADDLVYALLVRAIREREHRAHPRAELPPRRRHFAGWRAQRRRWQGARADEFIARVRERLHHHLQVTLTCVCVTKRA